MPPWTSRPCGWIGRWLPGNMEKLLKILAVLGILLCLMISSSATAARADCEGAATVTASALNMRSEATTDSSIVTCLPRGTVVLVTGSEGDWYQVSYQGNQGYMRSDYLTVSGTADANFGTGTIQGTDVRVRSGPDTSYSILGEEDTGMVLTVTGVSDSWLKVSYNGGTGYVKSTYLSLGGSGTGSSSSAASGTAGISSDSSNVTAASGTGTIQGTDVRLRSGPSTSHAILGSYDRGKTMSITGTVGDWYRVSCDGSEGYVYKTYLSTGGTDSTAGDQTVTAMSDTAASTISAVHFRTGPDTSYTSMSVLYAGTGVTITGETGDWYRVSYNGSTGYIFKTYLSTGSAGVSPTTGSEGSRIVAEAQKYLGVPYVYGGASPSGFDCSGFVYYVYRQCGYSITRTATTQNGDGYQVSRSELQPGDIIIFYNSARTAIGHSGIYIGNGQFIHASSGGGKVMVTNLSSSYYDARFYSARRVVG